MGRCFGSHTWTLFNRTKARSSQSPVPYRALAAYFVVPLAQLGWQNPEQGRIAAQVNPGQAVSVLITYDSGWRAVSGAGG
ncbi:hypothetical protein SBA3_1390017 [Candidatus Sulfopaludibacter sp. SbA3]|nr:hypothetical protein SBA3_1390017 [Candidatus Sulfopaludibacter sp. SbA3]